MARGAPPPPRGDFIIAKAMFSRLLADFVQNVLDRHDEFCMTPLNQPVASRSGTAVVRDRTRNREHFTILFERVGDGQQSTAPKPGFHDQCPEGQPT